MKTSILPGILAMMLLIGNVASGESYLITPGAPPVKKVLKSKKHKAVVQLYDRKIRVDLSGDNQTKPSSLLLTLFDEKNNPTTYELKSLSPPSSKGSENSGTSTYTGTLLYGRVPGEATTSAGTTQESFVGLEIRIPLGSTTAKAEPEILTLAPLE